MSKKVVFYLNTFLLVESVPTRNTDFFNMAFDYEIKVKTAKVTDGNFWPCQVNFEHGDLMAEV